ncbi:MAG: hypothetical protein AAFU72_00570, partial [Pseudomonadota bacterium]
MTGCMMAENAGIDPSTSGTPVAQASLDTAAPTPTPDPLGLSGAPLQPLLDRDAAEARNVAFESQVAALLAGAREAEGRIA